MRIALIPARGGSKRIPRKNIKPFCGQPIIGFSIQAALASGCFDRVIVSTDDNEIADVARKLGADVPFMRPAKLSDDYATTMDVIRHALEWYESRNEQVEAICCLYATAPFVTGDDLCKGYDVFEDSKASFVFSAAAYAFPIQRAFYLGAEDSVNMFQAEHLTTRSQDLTEAYHDAGQFYWCRREAIANDEPIFGPQSRAVILDRSRVQDIDTPEDWAFAQALYTLSQSSN